MFLYGDDFNTPDGTCVRDFIHVDDVHEMIVQSINYLERGKPSQVFNCGSGQISSMIELITAMKNASGVDFPVDILPPRLNEYPSIIADITRAKELLDWKPTPHSLESLCQFFLKLETDHFPKCCVFSANKSHQQKKSEE